MSNPNRASRHASGVLPSKQFFAPRKPIPSYPSSRRKSTLSASSPGSPTSNSPLSPSSSIRTPITSLILEEDTSTNLQRNSIPLDSLSSPTHETIHPTNDTTDANPIPVVRQGPYHARRSRHSGMSATGVLDPTSPSSMSEPTSSARGRFSDPMVGVNIKRLSSKHNSFLAVPYSSVNAKPNVQLTPHAAAGTEGDNNKGRRRVYQLWPGRNRFFLGGRIMTSRDFPAFVVALAALIIPSSLFLAFTCPFLYSHLSPAVVFVFAYLFLLALTSMLKTSWSDPGIIPRNLDPTPPTEESEVLDSISPNDNPFPYYQSRTYVLPKDVKVNGQTMILKYCTTCKIYRPPRCSHCRQCQNCVENEDHHCIWLNNCIGRRNYATFFTFILTATVICFYVLGFSLVHLFLLMHEGKKDFLEAIMDAPISFVLSILAFFLMWSVGGLTAYHMYLISKNLTTHEQLRAPIARRNGARHPFDRHNFFRNCFWVLCRPSINSTIHRRSFVDTTLPPTTAPTPATSFPNLFSTAAVSPLNTRPQSQTQIHEAVGSRDYQATVDANIA